MISGLNPLDLLRWRSIEAAQELAKSNNTKILLLGGQNGLPVMLNIGDGKRAACLHGRRRWWQCPSHRKDRDAGSGSAPDSSEKGRLLSEQDRQGSPSATQRPQVKR